MNKSTQNLLLIGGAIAVAYYFLKETPGIVMSPSSSVPLTPAESAAAMQAAQAGESVGLQF